MGTKAGKPENLETKEPFSLLALEPIKEEFTYVNKAY
jgi:hypothetical protein